MTLAELNNTDEQGFVARLGWVFEDSPWVAKAAWPHRPFASVESLHAAMVTAIHDAPREQIVALLRAHPDLGTKASMTEASVREQSGAGLNHLSAAQYDTLQRLNARYRERFGFPFLFAVTGATADAVLQSLERRVVASPEAEWREALAQVERIARLRLEQAIPQTAR